MDQKTLSARLQQLLVADKNALDIYTELSKLAKDQNHLLILEIKTAQQILNFKDLWHSKSLEKCKTFIRKIEEKFNGLNKNNSRRNGI